MTAVSPSNRSSTYESGLIVILRQGGSVRRHARRLAKMVENVGNWVPKPLTLCGKQNGAGNDFHANPCGS
jgi:hypothetical protein